MPLAEKLELSIKASGPQYWSSLAGAGRGPDGLHLIWIPVCGPSPQQEGVGTLERPAAPGETLIFPELYHFFHNTTRPLRWKVPVGS